MTTTTIANLLAFNPRARAAVTAAAHAQRRALEAWTLAAREMARVGNGEGIAAEISDRLEHDRDALATLDTAIAMARRVPGRIPNVSGRGRR